MSIPLVRDRYISQVEHMLSIQCPSRFPLRLCTVLGLMANPIIFVAGVVVNSSSLPMSPRGE